MVYLLGIVILIQMSSCGPNKPDYVDNSGKEYTILNRCVKSHTESTYGYHYGYNPLKGKFEYHYGHYTESVCDEYVLDTIEINKEEKYYSKK